ncbi:MAG: hypothetical protein R3D71_06775 [Rickettsiales bacterium]
MSDLRLITILPTQPAQGIHSQHTASGNQQSVNSLNSLTPGSVISGFIINRDSSGNPILRTSSGDITFSSNFFLKIGSEISIRVEHIAGNNTAHILSVNGQPPEIAAAQSSLTQEPEVIINANSNSNNKPSPSANANQQQTISDGITSAASKLDSGIIATVKGNVIAEPSNLSQSSTQNNSVINTLANTGKALHIGAEVTVKITAILQQTPSFTSASQTGKNIQANNQTNTNQPAVKAQEQPTSKNINITNESEAKLATNDSNIKSVNTPVQPSNKNAKNSTQTQNITPYAAYSRSSPNVQVDDNKTTSNVTGNNPNINLNQRPNNLPSQQQFSNGQLRGNVVSTHPNNGTVIHTDIGYIRVQGGINIPVGSEIFFSIDEANNTDNLTTPIVTTPSSPLTFNQLARSSGSLSNIFTLLLSNSSAEALNFINSNIPTIGNPSGDATNQLGNQHNILSPIVNLVVAMKDGDFRRWLGEANYRWLQNNGHGDLIRNAESEFSTLSRYFLQQPSHQWQSLFFPIAVDGELQQVRLFTKRDNKQKEKDGRKINEEDTRFILEVNLTQLGAMQMDGFVKRDDDDINFDLIIRSYKNIDKEVQENIISIYNNIGELTGYKGSISFQEVREFSVIPIEEIIGDEHEGTIV